MTNPNDVLNRVEAKLAQENNRQRIAHNYRINQTIISLIVLILVAAVIAGAGYFAYPYRENMVAWLRHPTIPQSVTVPTQTTCNDLEMDGITILYAPHIGTLSCIKDADKETWTTLYSDVTNQKQLAEHIVKISESKAMDVTAVQAAINDSLTTFRINLLVNGAQPVAPIASATLQVIATPIVEPTATQVPTPTPAATLIGEIANWKQPRTLAQLAPIILSNKIAQLKAVSRLGNTWLLEYDDTGTKRNLTLDGSNLPPECANPKGLTVSIEPLDGSVQFENLWVLCK